MKRYEQNVQDHQHYSEVFSEARSWIQEMCDKVSVCADTSGDRYAIQTQLEKLQVCKAASFIFHLCRLLFTVVFF